LAGRKTYRSAEFPGIWHTGNPTVRPYCNSLFGQISWSFGLTVSPLPFGHIRGNLTGQGGIQASEIAGIRGLVGRATDATSIERDVGHPSCMATAPRVRPYPEADSRFQTITAQGRAERPYSLKCYVGGKGVPARLDHAQF
jgi:hypothetical protein